MNFTLDFILYQKKIIDTELAPVLQSMTATLF